ncbi:hypothetical protein [Moraxella canis]|uniref:Uncharacterized protein n=1 Tax=Moraxella canis TaxID=90239 RepID=A0A1S9ZQ64_9GAMM|nr:hypothetical protein [Moraxella canis]OOR85480.1 hypothetical protein B0180_01435 [Moraxella canis]
MKESTTALALFVMPLAAAATIPAYANAGEVQGYMVDICKPAEAEGVEFADETLNRDFCSAQAAKAYKKFGTKDINFANKFVLTRMYGTSYVAIDPAKKQVYVMPFAIENSRNSGKPGKITFKKK